MPLYWLLACLDQCTAGRLGYIHLPGEIYHQWSDRVCEPMPADGLLRFCLEHFFSCKVLIIAPLPVLTNPDNSPLGQFGLIFNCFYYYGCWKPLFQCSGLSGSVKCQLPESQNPEFQAGEIALGEAITVRWGQQAAVGNPLQSAW